MEQQDQHRNFKASWFFKWFINNKAVTAFAVILLVLLNIFVLNKVGFIFVPVGEFLSIISLPVALAAVFYYLLNPVVDFFEKRKIPRMVTIAVLFIIIIGLIIWGLTVAIPAIVSGVTTFSNQVPHYVYQAQEQVNDLIQNPRFDSFRPQLDETMRTLGNNLVEWSRNFSSTAINTLTNVISRTADIVISIIIFPFVLFYLLRDGRNLNGYITNLLPPMWREETSKILSEMSEQLSSFVRGQVIVAFIVGVMFCIGYPIIGLRYAIPLAILSGIFNLVPFLGFYMAIVPAMIIGFATGGVRMLILVIVVSAIEQTIEGRLVSPLVLGNQLNMHPVTVLFVLLTGARILGIAGVLVAIPAYATAKVVIVHAYHWYKDISSLYPNENLNLQEPLEFSTEIEEDEE